MTDDELFSLVESNLDSLDIKSRKMFGGIGIFSEKIMFSLMYDGVLYFRSTEEIASGYSENSFQYQHPSRNSKMPYWSVSELVLSNKAKFNEWAINAFYLAKSLKRK